MSFNNSDNEKKIWNYFKSKDLNDYGIAGLMGNLYAESALNSKNMQNSYEKKTGYNDDTYTDAVDDGTYVNFINDKIGYGICQWTYHSRKKSLYEYAKSVNKSIGNIEMQLDFLYKELNESFKSVLYVLKTATSVLQASNAVLLHYEKPADQSVTTQNKRASYGQVYYDKYAASSSNNIGNIVTKEGESKMKYNASNKPLVCMQTNNKCYKNTKTMEVKGVLWHSTGCDNPTLKRYVQPSDNAADKEYWLNLLGKNKYNNDWNHTDRQAGMNCWIGQLADGTVATVQTMPWNYRPWGCGSGKNGSCNNTHIQFEIAEDSMYDKEYFDKVYKEACEITAYLCNMFNLDPHGTTITNGIKTPVILCHADSYNLGLGNNHGDIYTWFNKHGKDMNDVRNDVASLMGKSINISTAPTVSAPSENIAFIPYNVKITANVLNVRSGAGTNYSIIGTLKKDKIVTVIDKQNDWVKISDGWISASYVEKILDVSSSDKAIHTSNFTPYKIKVMVDELNIRKGAGTNYDINGVIKDKGIYTIIDEADGKGATKWLKLKSGAGYIASDYTTKI